MEEFLANKRITKVYRGKSGQGQYGPWTAWNFNIEGDDRKFSYFSGGKKPEPKEGDFIAMMKFETVNDGKYTNYKAKEVAFGQPDCEPRQDPPHDYEPPGEHQAPPGTQKPAQQSPRGDEKLSFYVSYAKDLKVALINQKEYPEGITLKECVNEVMQEGMRMQQIANGDIPF